MNMMSFSILFAVILLVTISQYSLAQEESEEPNSVPFSTGFPEGNEGIETSSYFPDHPDQKLPLGEAVSVLCHFFNDGNSPVNITSILGSLNSPFDLRFYVQNFTAKPFGIVVKEGEEITLEYQFMVHPSLEPIDYSMSHTVFYETDSQVFSTTFYNKTTEFYRPSSEADFETVLQVVFAILSSVAVIAAAYIGLFPENNSSSGKFLASFSEKMRK